MGLKEEIIQRVIEGNAPQTQALVEQALKTGLSPSEVLNDALIPAMTQVGELFQRGEYYVPEMLVAARAMKRGLAILQPLLVQTKVEPVGKIVIGTVKGDLHDIGKNLVALMLQGTGIEVIDLGVDVSPEQFVAAVREHHPQVVGASALLTTTMPFMKTTIEALKVAGLRDQVKVMIGGAPVTEQYAEAIGADLFARDAASAASKARQLLSR